MTKLNQDLIVFDENNNFSNFDHFNLLKKVVIRIANSNDVRILDGSPTIKNNEIYVPLSKNYTYAQIEGMASYEAAFLRYLSIEEPKIYTLIYKKNTKLAKILLKLTESYRISYLFSVEFPGFFVEYDRLIMPKLEERLEQISKISEGELFIAPNIFNARVVLEIILSIIWFIANLHPEFIYSEQLNIDGSFKFSSIRVGGLYRVVAKTFKFIRENKSFMASVLAAKEIAKAIEDYLHQNLDLGAENELSKAALDKLMKDLKEQNKQQSAQAPQGMRTQQGGECRPGSEGMEGTKGGECQTGSERMGGSHGIDARTGVEGMKGAQTKEGAQGSTQMESEFRSLVEKILSKIDMDHLNSKLKSRMDINNKISLNDLPQESRDLLQAFLDSMIDQERSQERLIQRKQGQDASDKRGQDASDKRGQDASDKRGQDASGEMAEDGKKQDLEDMDKKFSKDTHEFDHHMGTHAPSRDIFDETVSFSQRKSRTFPDTPGPYKDRFDKRSKERSAHEFKLEDKIRKLIEREARRIEKIMQKESRSDALSPLELVKDKAARGSVKKSNVYYYMDIFKHRKIELKVHVFNNINDIKGLNGIKYPEQEYDNIVQKNRVLIKELQHKFDRIREDRRLERGARRGYISARDLSYFKASKGKYCYPFKFYKQSKGAYVLIMVDESGSMNGHRIRYAKESCIVLINAFAGTSVHLSIVGFSAKAREEILCEKVYKEFDEPINPKKLGLINTASAYYANRDGSSFRTIVKKQFGKIPNREVPIVIIISDGAPYHDGTDYVSTKAVEHTKRTVNELRRAGIRLFAISIDSSKDPGYLGEIYGSKWHIHLKNARDLKKKVVGLADKIVQALN